MRERDTLVRDACTYVGIGDKIANAGIMQTRDNSRIFIVVITRDASFLVLAPE